MSADLLRDRYETLVVVGEGGEGRVVRALDHQHQRHVALKIRHVRSGDDSERLLNEARILLGLTPHPGLPLVRDDFFTDDGYVIVMDWISGRTLREVLDEEGRPGLPFDAVLDHLEQVADALDHLHAHDPPIVHRDVKPANIVLTDDDRVVLVDFGISSHRADPNRRGTWGYAAPELGPGADPTPAADVYGLAATAFALFNGRPPELGVRPAWPGLTDDQRRRVEQALRLGLSLDPSQRPRSATELLGLIRPRERTERPPGPTNIPATPTSFVGRRDDVARVRRLVRTHRMVTLTGEGGVGKTRLSYEAAAALRRENPDGVWAVELAALRDPKLLDDHVAAALGVATERSVTRAALHAHLAERRALLVLDNCEHLIDACADLALDLLRRCPDVRILATSRQPLGITEETMWRVSPLSIPPAGSPSDHLERAGAVRLFCDRARQARPGFDPSSRSLETIGGLCRRLDGLPLAIELAAARVKALSVSEIAERLDERFRLLASSTRASTPHHATLEAALDWSYDLLSERSQTLYARLACFSGSFTLEAAEQVCSGKRLADSDILDELTGLVDRSLLQTTEHAGRSRYRMLEVVKAHAATMLEASGEMEAVQARHLAWYADLAERASSELLGADQVTWLERLDLEGDNFRVALDQGLTTDPDVALGLAVRLADFWATRGYLWEGRHWLTRALAQHAEPDAVRARALSKAGVLAVHQGDWAAATSHNEEALEIFRRLGDDTWIAKTLNDLGAAADARGELDIAATRYEESLALCRGSRDRRGEAEALSNLGHVAQGRGDLRTARRFYEESLAVDRELGNQRGVADTMSNLGAVTGTEGDTAEAETMFTESLAIRRELGDRRGIAESLSNLGLLAQMRGDTARAAELFGQSLEIDRELGNRPGEADTLLQLGRLALAGGDTDEAADHSRAALSINVELADAAGATTCIEQLASVALAAGRVDDAVVLLGFASGSSSGREPSLAEARRHLGEDRFAELWEQGARMTLEEATRRARAGIATVGAN